MLSPLRIIFMGTPDFAVPALEHLIDGPHEVIGVYTQPPRPKGRGQKVQPSPVHKVADENNIPVHTPKSLRRDEQAQAGFIGLDADVAVVVAYGLLLPPVILEAPKNGCLNIHASLLPRWRGAAPIQYAIWQGDDKSGISIMQMDEGLDTGPVVAERAVPIRPQTTAQSLHDELAALGGVMIVEVLDKLARTGKLEFEPQDESRATYAPRLTKEDGKIDWCQTSRQIDCQIRALNPWPGVWTVTADDRRFKILEAEPVTEIFPNAPGTVIDHQGHVTCGGDTALRIISLQPDGKAPMDMLAAINGGYLATGAELF